MRKLLLLLTITMCACSIPLSAAPLQWDELAGYRQAEYQVRPETFLIVLPTGEETAALYAEYAGQNWPGVPTVTDREILDKGNPENRNLLLLGTWEGNPAIRNFFDPELRLLSKHPRAVFTVKCDINYPFRAIALCGGDSKAILTTRELRISPFDLSISIDGKIETEGFIQSKNKFSGNDFLLFNQDLKIVIPSGVSDPRPYLRAVQLRRTGTVTDAEVLADEEKYRNLIVVGTPENNRYLKHLLKELPVDIAAGGITGKAEHRGDMIFYGKCAAAGPERRIRILASNSEEALFRYRLNLSEKNLAFCDYEIDQAASGVTLERGWYAKEETVYHDGPKAPLQLMQEDADHLIELVTCCTPILNLNRQMFGIDTAANLRAFRDSITGRETPAEFARKMGEAIQSCKGNHFNLFWCLADIPALDCRNGVKGYTGKEYLIHGRTPEKLQEIHRHYQTELRKNRKRRVTYLGVPLLYLRGEYYTSEPYPHQGKVLPAGLKLLRVNGKTPEELQRDYKNDLFAWDSAGKHFYAISARAPSIAQVLLAADERKLDFEFQDAAGEKVDFHFDLARHEFARYARMFYLYNNPQVVYYEEEGVLYIRQPAMKDDKFYVEKLAALGPMPGLKAVIWDIRWNPGGGDPVWWNTLAAMTPEEMRYTFRLACKPTGFTGGRAEEIMNADFLGGETFAVRHTTFRVKPSKDSLKLDVPIYILTEDVSSAASKLFVFARGSDRLTSIGGRNTYLCGAGGAPSLFGLPNSGLVVRNKLCLNLEGSEKAEDLLNSVPEVELQMTLDEMLEFHNPPPKATPAEMFRSDPYIRRILQRLNE